MGTRKPGIDGLPLLKVCGFTTGSEIKRRVSVRMLPDFEKVVVSVFRGRPITFGAESTSQLHPRNRGDITLIAIRMIDNLSELRFGRLRQLCRQISLAPGEGDVSITRER